MKKIFTAILALTSVLCLSSCEDWLQATSSTQFQADQIFETRDGYLDALTGVYLIMGESSVYGGDVTWKFPDLMVYPYDSFQSKHMQSWQSHDYSYVDVRSDIESIWRGYYNIVANVNMILSRLDAGKELFLGDLEYNLVKGELLAIRAYVHFDLMRLFGPSEWGGENASKLTVPYVTSYSMETTSQRTFAETEEMLFLDLNQALELLANDPVTGVVPDGFNQGANADGYWNKRQRHLNLYATEALAARIYSWKKDYQTAADYAQKALDGALQTSLTRWLDADEILTAYKDEEKDWTFSCEHIFALEITGLSNSTMGYLIPGSSTSDAFHLSKTVMDDMYHSALSDGSPSFYPGQTQEGLEDIRGEALLLKYSQGAYDCYKFYGTSSSLVKYRNIMPMIKMSEMCYIIAENYIQEGKNSEAIDMLDLVRLHRGIQDELGDDEDAYFQLAKDVFKEFLNEGQMLFWFRHINDQSREVHSLMSYAINYSGINTRYDETPFILPYPDSETSYGRKQEL